MGFVLNILQLRREINYSYTCMSCRCVEGRLFSGLYAAVLKTNYSGDYQAGTRNISSRTRCKLGIFHLVL